MKNVILFVAMLIAHLSYASPPIYGKSNFDQKMVQSAILLLKDNSPDGKILCSSVDTINAEIIHEKITKNGNKYSQELWHLSGCDGTDSVIATLYPSGLVGIQNAEQSISTSESISDYRSPQEISVVMNQHKGIIYLIYKKALQNNPALKGKMNVKIVIDPSGTVEAKIISSNLNDNELENAILRRIRMITFPPSSNLNRTTVNHTFDFFPR